uniref:Uncharacterized protein n=1 Tax=Aegilops tauschii subsp. strangulata TaxID=200361 RepID=A0A453K9H5_AEGTS
MDIIMLKVYLSSDTCNLYFTYIKRYCRSLTDDDEECKRQETSTPSAREAWKRRQKKTELQQSYNHRTSDATTPRPARRTATGARYSGRTADEMPDVRHTTTTTRLTATGNPAT